LDAGLDIPAENAPFFEGLRGILDILRLSDRSYDQNKNFPILFMAFQITCF
jgi:hypothetical protein